MKRLAVFGLCLLAVIAALFLWHVWLPGAPFDRDGWHDPQQVKEGVRLTMADRLIARRALDGMTRNEVVNLLGEPPRTGYFSHWDLVYWLGPERGWCGIDSEWLVIRLGNDGRVAECRIARD